MEVHLANGQDKTFIIYSDNPFMIRMNLPYTGDKLLQYRGGRGVHVHWPAGGKGPRRLGSLVRLLMVVGIYVAFFMSHRRIWMRVENRTVIVGGNASKNQAGFQLFMERLVTKLKKQLPLEDNK